MIFTPYNITGILKDKTIDDKLTYIPYDDKLNLNYPFCRLELVVKSFDNNILELNNANTIKKDPVFEPTNKITQLYNFGLHCYLQSNIPFLPLI